MINIDKIEVNVGGKGHITNCYLVYDDSFNGVLIDPGDEPEKIINEINTKKCNVKYIIITHAHADHMGALSDVRNYTNAKILVHVKDLEALLEKQENYEELLNVKKQNINENDVKVVKDNEEINVGDLNFVIIHTPGHTAGSMCILEKNNMKLFTGDTVFWDTYGRCDLYSGDFPDMVESLRRLFNTFSNIDIYPGHGKTQNIDITKRYIKMLMAVKNIKL